MKKLALLRSLALAAAIACSPSLFAQQEGGTRPRQGNDAQSTQSQQTDQADQTNRGADRGAGRGAADRDRGGRGSGTAQPGINETRQTDRTGVNTTTGDAVAANAGQAGQMEASTEVQKILTGKLINGNKAEVELGKLAQQRAENDQVKQFAQHMVEQHTQMLQKLTSLHQQSGQGHGQSSQGGQSGRAAQSDATSQGGQGGTGGQLGSGATNRSAQAGAHAGMASDSQTLQQLTSIADRAHENCLKMTRQMLEQHKGQEFDMAYIGQQIVAHTDMLAHLQAMQGVGDQQFQQLVQQATQTTQQHLDQAKNIAQQLKNQKT